MWKNNKKNKDEDLDQVDSSTNSDVDTNSDPEVHKDNQKVENHNANKETTKNTNTTKQYELLLKENESLNRQIDELKKQLQNSEHSLRQQQMDFVEKLKQKAKEAQLLVDEKQKELDDKFIEELEQKKSKIYKSEMIGVIDALEQFEGIVNNPVDDSKLANYLIGFKMILTMFENALNDMHISKLQVKVGDELDPNLMDAFEVVEVDGFKHNQVVEVIRNAYKYKDVVIKHAVVKVQK